MHRRFLHFRSSFRVAWLVWLGLFAFASNLLVPCARARTQEFWPEPTTRPDTDLGFDHAPLPNPPAHHPKALPPETMPIGKSRNSFWSLSLTSFKHGLKAIDDNEFIGNATAVNLGWGYLGEAWFFNTTLDIILGPFEPAFKRQFNVDYYGTGLSLWTGVSAQTLNLRTPGGSYGFAVGVNYADLAGHSIGRNRNEADPPENPANIGLPMNYDLRVNSLAIIPALFFTWLNESRPKGNTPELLMTRVEGYQVIFGIAIPWMTTYGAKFDRRLDPAAPPPPGSKTPPISEPVSQSGKLRGYSILINFSALFGV